MASGPKGSGFNVYDYICLAISAPPWQNCVYGYQDGLQTFYFLLIAQDCLVFKGIRKMLLLFFFNLLFPILRLFHIAEGFLLVAMA